MLSKFIVGAASLALISGTAFAATTVTTADHQHAAPADAAVVIDFNSHILPAGFTLSGNYALVTGTVSGQYSAPANSPTTRDGSQYLVVPAQGVHGSAVLLGGTGYDRVSFMWGSIDHYNSVQLLDAAGNAFGSTIFGNSVAVPSGNGDQLAGGTNRRIFIQQGAGDQLIYGLRFTNTSARAFELDNVAFGAVPEPTTWAMLIAGFGLVGGALRRRATTQMVVA